MVAVGVLILLATLGTLSFLHLTDARHSILGEIDPASLSADQLLVAYLDQETGVRGYILSHNSVFLQPAVQGVKAQATASRQLKHALAQRPPLLRLATLAERSGGQWQREFAQPAIAATAAGSDTYGSAAALDRGKGLFDATRSRFATLDHALAMARTTAGDSLNVATELLLATLAFGLLLLATAGILLNRALRVWVTEPLSDLRSDSRQVATGELAHEIEPAGPTEIRELGEDVEAMRQRIVSELREVAVAGERLDALNVDLARSNAELEQFAYVASHDLQEPLRKVTSFVQLLQQRYQGQLDDRADQYIEFAVDGATRMQRLINDLLTFSRVGRTTEGFSDVPLGDCVRAARENLASAIDESGATVEYGHLPTVRGDPTLMISLWQNLIGNSIKFRRAEPPCILIDWVRTGDDWIFGVSDNGIGIEPRFADKIFVIFQRLHGREAYEGTGIGLAMCKKIVEFHGGGMWLDTAPRTGTRIAFSLPVPLTEGHP
ncbi:MAG TPA: ATP-binding protein [Acidimicrobiales bacterium]|nr:ATP-binding protein [Acidimicrobiales bacterium]